AFASPRRGRVRCPDPGGDRGQPEKGAGEYQSGRPEPRPVPAGTVSSDGALWHQELISPDAIESRGQARRAIARSAAAVECVGHRPDALARAATGCVCRRRRPGAIAFTVAREASRATGPTPAAGSVGGGGE